MVQPRRIADFKPTLSKLATTSHYQVIFGGLPSGLRQHLNVRDVGWRFTAETIGLLCNNAVLPGSAVATGILVPAVVNIPYIGWLAAGWAALLGNNIGSEAGSQVNSIISDC